MKHSQPPTPVATDNSAAESVLNGTAKQKSPEQSTCDFIGCGTEFAKANFMYFGRRENKMWPIITRNTTQLPTTELCAQPYFTRRPRPTQRSRQTPSLPARVC
eukprot:scaffold66883_cov24-Attheya_sp.AAC.1